MKHIKNTDIFEFRDGANRKLSLKAKCVHELKTRLDKKPECLYARNLCSVALFQSLWVCFC